MIKQILCWFRTNVTPIWVLFFFCVASFVQGGIANGVMISCLTTLEKRFGISSSGSASIISAYHVGAFLTLPMISYYGGKSHKPRWVGFGLMAFGAFTCLFTMPHFIVPYSVNTNVTNALCSANDDHIPANCREKKEESFYLYYFVVVHALNGIASVPLFTLAVAYLDEITDKAKSALYNGVFFSSAFMGSGVGFFVGGATLQLNTYLNQRIELTSENNPNWVGAWWLGYLIFGGVAIFASLPIIMLPRKIREHDKHEREQEIHNTSGIEQHQHHHYGKDLHSLIQNTSLLFRNLPFLLLGLVASLDFFSIAGLVIFLPKYLESGFGITASAASFYMGLLVVLGSSLGQVAGGFVVFKFNLKVSGIMKLNILFTVITATLAAALFIKCPSPEFASATLKYPTDSINLQCLQSCNCNNENFMPVCSNNVMYFSPCHAGCQFNAVDNIFSNCSCVFSALNRSLTVTANATLGSCTDSSPCPNFNIFMVVIFFFMMAAFFTRAPEIQATLRVVPYKFRSFAMGWQWSLIRVIGAIPGPLIYAKIFETSCFVWSTICGKSETCRFYNNEQFYFLLFVLAAGQKGVNIVLMVLAYYIYKPMSKDLTENESQQTIESQNPVISTPNGKEITLPKV